MRQREIMNSLYIKREKNDLLSLMCQALRFLSEKRQMWLMFSGVLIFSASQSSGGAHSDTED